MQKMNYCQGFSSLSENFEIYQFDDILSLFICTSMSLKKPLYIPHSYCLIDAFQSIFFRHQFLLRSFISLKKILDSIFPLSCFPFQAKNFPRSRNNKIAVQNVLIPKIIVDISFFIKYGILKIFDAQGWLKLFTDDKPIFPWLVKQFYANLIFSQNSRTQIGRAHV